MHCKCCLRLSTQQLSRGYQMSVLQISSKCTKVVWKWPCSGKDVLLPSRSKFPSRLAASDFSSSFGKRLRSTTFSKSYHCLVWSFLMVNLIFLAVDTINYKLEFFIRLFLTWNFRCDHVVGERKTCRKFVTILQVIMCSESKKRLKRVKTFKILPG